MKFVSVQGRSIGSGADGRTATNGSPRRRAVACARSTVLAAALALAGCEGVVVRGPVDGGDASIDATTADAPAVDAADADADVEIRCNVFEGGQPCDCDGGQIGHRACVGGVLSGACTCRPPCSVTGCGDHQQCLPDGTCACASGWSLIRGFCQCVVPMEQCNPRDGGA